MYDCRFSRAPAARLCFMLAALFLVDVAAASAATISSSSASDFAQAARSVSRGESLRVEATPLDGHSDATGLDLVRFEPVREGASFVLQTDSGPRAVTPELPVYFRGSVDGLPGSVAVLSVRASGEVRGIVSARDGTWTLAREPGPSGSLRSRRMDHQSAAKPRNFSCEVAENPSPRRIVPAASSFAATSASTARLPIVFTAQIAVELDYDYYLAFAPDADAAVLYALDLVAFLGVLGEAELGMNTQVPFLQLWTTSSDPYSSSSLARLGQVRARWNESGATNCGGMDCTAIDRSTVILLSSATDGGVAYVPALCDSWHSPTAGYSYAFAGSISGSFDIDSPTAVWDIVATTHEIGHNLGSHHTHCYDPPVDRCYGAETGCYAGPNTLPAGCPGHGQGCGTIMGYCHLLGGGMGNVTLTYGAGHPYGDDPDRVTDTMIARIALEAAAAPGCLAPTAGLVELSISKAGNGSGTVTSQPEGIDCGSACSGYFNSDTVVTLTPTPTTFSTFAGWSGDADCSDGIVTLSASASCVATFNGSCGAGNDDCDDGNPCTADSCPGDDHCENNGTPRDAATCYEPLKSKLKVVNAPGFDGDKIAWQWIAGEAFDQAALGDPSSDTDYTLCIYDATASTRSLAAQLTIPAGSPGWRNYAPRGWKWANSSGFFDGITKLQLATGVAGKTKVKLNAAGGFLPLPSPFSGSEFFDQDPSVIVQLLADEGNCWTATLSTAGTTSNLPESFKAAGN